MESSSSPSSLLFMFARLCVCLPYACLSLFLAISVLLLSRSRYRSSVRLFKHLRTLPCHIARAGCSAKHTSIILRIRVQCTVFGVTVRASTRAYGDRLICMRIHSSPQHLAPARDKRKTKRDNASNLHSCFRASISSLFHCSITLVLFGATLLTQAMHGVNHQPTMRVSSATSEMILVMMATMMMMMMMMMIMI